MTNQSQKAVLGADKTPVRVGDRFRSKSGRVWKCIGVKPFGVREFMAEDRAIFWDTTTVQMRLSAERGVGMERLS